MTAADAPRRRIGPLVRALRRAYPDAECALRHSNALQLLVATILSAQCTDVRVNQVTPALFRRYRTAGALAKARPEDVEKLVRPTGFFRSKARSLIGMARMLVSDFGGRVPSTMAELVRLPGVARKTANVVLGTWFGRAEGVVVDTHVRRIARLLKLTREEDPVKIEADLMDLLPRREWTDFSHRLIWHGRKVCIARRPQCTICPLGGMCPSKGLFHVERSHREPTS